MKPLPGLGCRAEQQLGEVGLIGGSAVKALMWAFSIVQRDEATPIGPRSAKLSIFGIRYAGPGLLLQAAPPRGSLIPAEVPLIDAEILFKESGPLLCVGICVRHSCI